MGQGVLLEVIVQGTRYVILSGSLSNVSKGGGNGLQGGVEMNWR